MERWLLINIRILHSWSYGREIHFGKSFKEESDRGLDLPIALIILILILIIAIITVIIFLIIRRKDDKAKSRCEE